MACRFGFWGLFVNQYLFLLFIFVAVAVLSYALMDSTGSRNSSRQKKVKSAPLKVGIPAELIPAPYLTELSNAFKNMKIVKRAAYGLMERSGQLSYLIMLDLEVAPEKKQDAIYEVIMRVQKQMNLDYEGRWPLDFGIWNDKTLNRSQAAI